MSMAAGAAAAGADQSFGRAEEEVGAAGVAEEEEAGAVDFPVAEDVLAAAERAVVGNMKTKDFVQALDEKAIADAVAQAEKQTSGEIRVFVSEKLIENPVAEAEKEFVSLGMTKTKKRNGVLIYFAPKSQKYAVIGDAGVHQRCGQNFWQHITSEMTPLLKAGKYSEAILLAVKEVGAVLAREFPWEPGDRNELPNQIARDKK